MLKLDKSKLVTNLGKKYRLAPYLDKCLGSFDGEWKFEYGSKHHDTAWHPSGHCLPPATQLFEYAWNVVNGAEIEEENFSASTRKKFMAGHFWHQYLQHIVLHELKFCKPEAIERVGKKEWGTQTCYYWGGSGDGVWLPRPFHWVRGAGDIAPCEAPNWKGVVDFKTMSSPSFKQSIMPENVADKYECQINIYMDLFDEENGLIVGVNLDSPHDFKEFEYVRNQPLIDAIYDKWKFVSECLDEGLEPGALELALYDEEHELPLASNASTGN